MGMKKIYIGGGYTYASEERRAEFEAIIDSLRKDFIVLDWFRGEGTPTEVYESDIKNIKECDLFIAVLNDPGTGFGIEVGAALALG